MHTGTAVAIAKPWPFFPQKQRDKKKGGNNFAFWLRRVGEISDCLNILHHSYKSYLVKTHDNVWHVYPWCTILIYLVKQVISEQLQHVAVTRLRPLWVQVKPVKQKGHVNTHGWLIFGVSYSLKESAKPFSFNQ